MTHSQGEGEDRSLFIGRELLFPQECDTRLIEMEELSLHHRGAGYSSVQLLQHPLIPISNRGADNQAELAHVKSLKTINN